MNDIQPPPAASEVGVGAMRLRARYESERDRRLREDGATQYVDINDYSDAYKVDPYVEEVVRAPIEANVDVVIVGGGFAGMLAAIQLKQRGVTDIRIVERASDFGGTWYWNRYPGAQCDVESYMYLPLLEDTNYVPREKYSYRPEIFAYARKLAAHYSLYDHAMFQTRAEQLRWDEAEKAWIMRTSRGDKLTARHVIIGGAIQDRPKLPGIPGLADFKGPTFHTSRWDYGVTGGEGGGPMTGLHGKRVAVIGTGATGIQCVPFLARDAADLLVLQRTPSVVGERLNRPTDPLWAATLGPGWQERRMANYSTIVLGGHQDEDLVDDGWTHAARELNSIYGGKTDAEGAADPAVAEQQAELADFRYMEKLRGRIDRKVTDAAKAEILKPWYRYFCKRPTFNDEYLDTFNRDNVRLLDVSGPQGIDRLTEDGLVVRGVEYKVDVIVFATGFEVSKDPCTKLGIEIAGRNGQTLAEHWVGGARTLYGLMAGGFPNFFLMGTVQTGLTINYTEMALRQASAIAEVVRQTKVRQARTFEPSPDAEAAYGDEIVAGAAARLKFLAACTPSYFNNEGRPTIHGKGITDAQYGGGLHEWHQRVQDWLSDGNLHGLQID